jgi:hypothetical protein
VNRYYEPRHFNISFLPLLRNILDGVDFLDEDEILCSIVYPMVAREKIRTMMTAVLTKEDLNFATYTFKKSEEKSKKSISNKDSTTIVSMKRLHALQRFLSNVELLTKIRVPLRCF